MFKQKKYVLALLLLWSTWAQAVVSLPTDGLGAASSIPSAASLLPGNPFGGQDNGVQASASTVTITQNGETTVYRSEDGGNSSVGIGAVIPGLGLTSTVGRIGGPLMPYRAIGVLSIGGLTSPGIRGLPIGFLPVAGRGYFIPPLRLP